MNLKSIFFDKSSKLSTDLIDLEYSNLHSAIHFGYITEAALSTDLKDVEISEVYFNTKSDIHFGNINSPNISGIYHNILYF